MTNAEKLERAEHELSCLEEAIGYLGEVRNTDGIVQGLRDMMIVIGFERETLHAALEREDARDIDELNAEYRLSLM